MIKKWKQRWTSFVDVDKFLHDSVEEDRVAYAEQQKNVKIKRPGINEFLTHKQEMLSEVVDSFIIQVKSHLDTMRTSDVDPSLMVYPLSFTIDQFKPLLYERILRMVHNGDYDIGATEAGLITNRVIDVAVQQLKNELTQEGQWNVSA